MALHKQSPGGVLQNRILKNSTKFAEKHLYWSISFNKVAGSEGAPTILFKKNFWHMCSPVNFAKFSKTTYFLRNNSMCLLLTLDDTSIIDRSNRRRCSVKMPAAWLKRDFNIGVLPWILREHLFGRTSANGCSCIE